MTTTRIKRKFLDNIDLTHMNREERRAVGRFLETHQGEAVILRNTRCKADVKVGKSKQETIRYTFGIDNKLLHEAGSPTFDVQSNEKVGRGAFGKVRPMLGRLTRKDNGEAYFTPLPKDQPSLIKKIKQQRSETEEDFLGSIAKEYAIAEKTPHLFFEPLIDVPNPKKRHRHIAYIRMPYFKGGNLYDLIQSGSLNKIDDMIEICLNAAISLQMMFHDRGLVHRDIKPKNMTVTRFKKVAIYDVGLAKERDEEVDCEYVGTMHYISPEQINQEKTTPATDIYALGKTYAKIWRLTNGTFFDEEKALTEEEAEEIEKIVRSGDAAFDRKEFNTLKGIKDGHKDSIVKLIQSMTRLMDNDRCDLDHVIALWDKIKLERKLSASPKYKHNKIREAHQLAIHERHELRKNLRRGESFTFKM